MLQLIQNCSHDNGVVIFLSEEKYSNAIIKASSNIVGIMQITQELKGWEWYLGQKGSFNSDKCRVVCKREKYIKIKIPYINGKKAKYSNGLIKNSNLVGKIVEHYCRIWKESKKDKYPLHGDLSIDNIIYNNEGIHIIDWEYFTFDAAPFGFDTYNLLFEQLLFSMKGRIKPTIREIDVLKRNIEFLRSVSSDDHYFKRDPLSSTQKFIKANSKLWNNQIKRLPIFFFKKESVEHIDKTLNSKL